MMSTSRRHNLRECQEKIGLQQEFIVFVVVVVFLLKLGEDQKKALSLVYGRTYDLRLIIFH